MSEAGATGGFTLTRTGGKIADALTVTYSISGTADVDDDFVELPGSMTFPAGAETVHIDLEAIGDNLAEDAESVVLELTGSGSTYVLGDADEATVTILDQSKTVSVRRHADGEEGSNNGAFKFTRAGDISEELTLSYEVGGTATSVSNADFTALSGTVTFNEDEDEVFVSIVVTDDNVEELTETVMLTIEEDEDYLIANGSDTIFLSDNDTEKVYWISSGSTDWDIASNWSINAVPDETHDVYFWASKSNVDCANLGEGEDALTFRGLFVESGYSGTITMVVPFSASTFELTSEPATIDQPTGADITITGAMLWTNGTLNSIDSGASVTIDGGSGFIDPPDTGTISTASTISIASGSQAAFLPGEVNFDGGDGIENMGNTKLVTGQSVELTLTKAGSTGRTIWICEGTVTVARADAANIAKGTTQLPILNTGGSLEIKTGVHWTVSGRIGNDGPSISQSAGSTLLDSFSRLSVPFGLTIAGGELTIELTSDGADAVLDGNLTMAADSKLAEGLGFHGKENWYGKFEVRGNVTWTSGYFSCHVDGTNGGKRDLWSATGQFRVDTAANFAPLFKSGTEGAIGNGRTWEVVKGNEGIKNADGTANATPPALDLSLQAYYDMQTNNVGDLMVWKLHRKPHID